MRAYVVGAVLALSLTGINACGSADDASKDPAGGNPSTSSPASPTTVATPTAAPASTPKTDGASVAAKIKKSVPSVSKVVRITEDNDPNDKIGRPGGYVDGAVLYDKAASCTELGADCGATIEIWGSPEDAKS